MAAIELARRRVLSAAVLSGGVAATVLCVQQLQRGEQPRDSIVLGVVIGALIALLAARHLFALSPRFRATPRGVWFGGGWTIPWSEIKAVYGAAREPRGGGTVRQVYNISFEFHHTATLFKTPVAGWLLAPLAVGSIDVWPAMESEHVTLMVAQLEVMRAGAVNAVHRIDML